MGGSDANKRAIKQAFDAYFIPGYRLSLPAECLDTSQGGFHENGWDVHYRLGVEDGVDFIECFAAHRMTNDRLYRIYADGRVELIAAGTDGMLPDHDRQFYEELRRRGHT